MSARTMSRPGETATQASIGVDEALGRITGAQSRKQLIGALKAICRVTNPGDVVLYYSAAADENASHVIQRIDEGNQCDAGLRPMLHRLCQQAIRDGKALLGTTTDGFPCPMIAVPIPAGSRGKDALGVIVLTDAGTRLAERFEHVKLTAAHLSTWYARRAEDLASRKARAATAYLEMLTGLAQSDELNAGVADLADRIRSWLGCRNVAVGVCSGSSRHCRMIAMSGMSKFDKRADTTCAIESAFDEAILANAITRWPSTVNQPAPTLERVRVSLGASQLVTVPLHDSRCKPIGAILLIDPDDENRLKSEDRVLVELRQTLAAPLRLLVQTQGNTARRFCRGLSRRLPRRRRWIALLLLALVAMVLAIPRTHRIGCDCQLQPEVRRYVSVPFDGTLLESKAKPGDIVEAGQELARMDDRDIRLELSGLEAELNRAQKAWEVALSLDDIHEAQQARLEMRRLESKIDLLRSRESNVSIRSPLRGVLISGDLENSQGATLEMGEVLFEIAPLERMKVEVTIAEEDISYVTKNMEAQIRLEAHPRQLFSAHITRIVPRAQAREEQFVFLAEAELRNTAETLRPGMNGQATLIGSKRPLGWLLFHKPIEYVQMTMGW